MPDADTLDATIIITTKNRADELRRALSSCLRQSGAPDVLVIDDGSSDGTSDMVRREFPSVRIDRCEESKGLIVQRNRGARLARSRVIISIDDDCEFPSPSIVARTLADFDDARVGAVTIPLINVLQDKTVLQRCPQGQGRFAASSYLGGSCAIRRDLFLRLGGYREQLFHQCEEGDFCVRMLDAGFVVRLGSADPIHHYESPKRDTRRMDMYGGRNRVLFEWHNAPARHVVPGWSRAIASRIRWGLRKRRVLRGLHSAWFGFSSIAAEWRARSPVGNDTYRLYREVERRGAVPFDELCRRLPARADQDCFSTLAFS